MMFDRQAAIRLSGMSEKAYNRSFNSATRCKTLLVSRQSWILENWGFSLGALGSFLSWKRVYHCPISNAPDVVQGSRSVEVRAVGVTKGAAIDPILGEIVHSKSMITPIDYVLCIGHFLGKVSGVKRMM